MLSGRKQTSKYFFAKKRACSAAAQSRSSSSSVDRSQRTILSFFDDNRDENRVGTKKKRRLEASAPRPEDVKEKLDSDMSAQLFLPLPEDLLLDVPATGEKQAVVSAPPTKLTPLEKQVVELKERHPHLILFVEVGYRYRFFGSDAEIAARVFRITCHQDRNFMTASVPTFNGPGSYVRKLVSEGYKVGVVSQTETAAGKQTNPDSTLSGPFQRSLTAVYTRTTLLGEDVSFKQAESMAGDPTDNAKSMVMAIYEEGRGDSHRISLCAAQPTTGQFLYAEFEDHVFRNELRRCLDVVGPVEILVPSAGLSELSERMIAYFCETNVCNVRVEKVPMEATATFPHDVAESESFSQVLPDFSRGVRICVVSLMNFLRELQLAEAILRRCSVQKIEQTSHNSMLLPSFSLVNLEVFQTMKPSKTNVGTLYHELNRTKTRPGARLLRDWIASPLLNISEISERQNSIDFLICSKNHRTAMIFKECLNKLMDLEVALTACLCKKIRCGDFIRLCGHMQRIYNTLRSLTEEERASLSPALKRIVEVCIESFECTPNILSNLNQEAARKGELNKLFYNWEFHPDVDAKRKELRQFEKMLDDHREEIKMTLNIKEFEYTCVSALEYLVEVTHSLSGRVPSSWTKVNSTKKVNRYRTPFLSQNLPRLAYLRECLEKECRSAWYKFLEQFNQRYYHYALAAQLVAELDCLLSLAEVSSAPGFVRPVFDEQDQQIHIVGGRNLIVESLLPAGKVYVPNDVALGVKSGPLSMVLTGPNMGGKSCLLKQVGLTTIMAQIGCFVPAESAKLPIFDQLFVRVGARDDIFTNKSTLMVELEEASTVLAKATNRSLVLLDELGRGTSTCDGSAVAKAVLRWLSVRIRCLTIFVTHYREVTELQEELGAPAVSNMHMGYVREEEVAQDSAVLFLYKLRKGRSEGSFAFQVAKMAGLDGHIITLAKEVARKGLMASSVK